MAFSISSATLVSIIFITRMLSDSDAVDFVVINNAGGTDGGKRFDREFGQSGGLEIMDSGTKFIWDVFRQPSPANRRIVQNITLIVESMDMDRVSYTGDDEIHLSAEYVGNYSGDVKREIKGIVYHELVHSWQWNGNWKAPSRLIEGIADYVRLTAGLAPSFWGLPGSGDRWDQGFGVTVYFLQYCENISSGFIANMNAKLASDWSLQFFTELTGRSVDQIWKDYKDKYASSSVGTYVGAYTLFLVIERENE